VTNPAFLSVIFVGTGYRRHRSRVWTATELKKNNIYQNPN